LWRIRSDGRRMHAYDNDVQRAVENRFLEPQLSVAARHSIQLLPRALFMTMLVRLGMCDLFIHGRGGANYDRAMERWLEDWLGVRAGRIAAVSADVHLPLRDAAAAAVLDPHAARNRLRHLWHNPEAAVADTSRIPSAMPGDRKQRALEKINQLERGDPRKRAAFLAMHEELAALRQNASAAIEKAEHDSENALRAAADERIAQRRDWAFPLYPPDQIDRLQEQVRSEFRDSAPAKR
jgi:hypothetical protein